jgi:nucleoside-diphosphate-sugar epimerase
VSAAIAGQPPVVFGDGEQSRDFTYVENVVHANLLAMAAPDVGGRVYNVACGERVTLNRLIRELGALLGQEIEPVYAPPRSGDVTHSLADLSRARRDLGYEPSVPLRDGLRRTIEHARLEQPAPEASDWVLAGEP